MVFVDSIHQSTTKSCMHMMIMDLVFSYYFKIKYLSIQERKKHLKHKKKKTTIHFIVNK